VARRPGQELIARAGWARRRAFEALGSPRYSRPALNGLDVKLERFLPERGGTFVEAGAGDGFVQSKTYYLERFKGWSGVLIEGIPELAERCARRRPHSQTFNCALVANDFPEAIVTMRYSGLKSVVPGARSSVAADEERALPGKAESTTSYEVMVPAGTLSSVLDEARVSHVDLLSLGVEGYEDEVLRGLDLSRHAPRYMLIEIAGGNERKRVIETGLGERYRELARLSPQDFLYARSDVRAPAAG
jgi:FkbM family methyltransferase